MSTYVKDCDCEKDWYNDKEKYIDDRKRDRFFKPIILSCGTSNSIDFDGSDTLDEVVLPDPSSGIVAQVVIDTSGICKPKVEIEFSSIVNFVASFQDARGAVNFRLFRTCDNQEQVLLNTWTYEVVKIEDLNTIALSNSFSFIFCDFLKTPGCCSYFVEASVGDLVNVERISINNIFITAIAQ